MKSRVIEFEEIKSILPHRYPFLLVDRVLGFDETSIKAIKNVTANEEFFQGHFPNYAVMPGVLIIEALAQVGAIYVVERLRSEGKDVSNALALFAGIENAKFKRSVHPGDQLVLEASYVKDKMGIWWLECKASVDGKVVCSALASATVRI